MAKDDAVARSKRLDDLIAGLLGTLDLRAKSLIVTVFGDSIAPHGGPVWLGSLITLVRPLGLSERVVRTAIFRLTRDDWLTGRAIGRRSYYGPSESGRRRFDEAHRRIYAPPRRAWDGSWHLVLSNGAEMAAERRDRLRRELLWQGFGQVAPGVMAHPAADPQALRRLLDELGLAEAVVAMRASTAEIEQRGALRRLVQEAWDLGRLDHDYHGFLGHFRPVLRALETAEAAAPESCFVIRTLLIHDYRRVLLRDPLLPDELLPADWPGRAARLLCRNLYRLTQGPAEQHVMAVLQTADGALPAAAPAYRSRFGGLDGEVAA